MAVAEIIASAENHIGNVAGVNYIFHEMQSAALRENKCSLFKVIIKNYGR